MINYDIKNFHLVSDVARSKLAQTLTEAQKSEPAGHQQTQLGQTHSNIAPKQGEAFPTVTDGRKLVPTQNHIQTDQRPSDIPKKQGKSAQTNNYVLQSAPTHRQQNKQGQRSSDITQKQGKSAQILANAQKPAHSQHLKIQQNQSSSNIQHKQEKVPSSLMVPGNTSEATTQDKPVPSFLPTQEVLGIAIL